MKRREWEFQKTAAELAEAASKNSTYHLERAGWWEGERRKAEAAIREAGIDVRVLQQTGGDRHQLVGDPALVGRFAECGQKIDHHRARSDEYAQWYAALKTANGTLTLDHDDWLFFFGLRGERRRVTA